MARNTDIDRGRSAFGLTPSGRGWYKRMPGAGVKWVVSFNHAPTAIDADRVFAERFSDLAAPPTDRTAVTLNYAANAYLEAKELEVDPHTYKDYKAIFKHFQTAIGEGKLIAAITPDDFSAYAKTIAGYSVVRRTKIVGVIRSGFNWWRGQQWIGEVAYGSVFVQPSKKQARIDRARRPRRMYTPDEIHALLALATPMMKAAVLLGINGGFGPSDVSRVTVDLIDGDVMRADRRKTGATRIVPLWPETLAALRALPPDDSGRLFYGRQGAELEALNNRGITRRFTELCGKAEVPAHGFYTLRRTFRTVADAVADRRAVDIVTGHVQEDMGSVYVQEVHLDRLRAVTDHVLRWLFSPAAERTSSDVKTKPKPRQTPAADRPARQQPRPSSS